MPAMAMVFLDWRLKESEQKAVLTAAHLVPTRARRLQKV